MDERISLAQVLTNLRDPEEPIGRYLAFALSGVAPREAQQLVAMLDDLDVDRRRELYRVLLETSEEEFLIDLINVFVASLVHGDPVVRVHAIKGLWPDPKPRIAHMLLALLRDDPETEVRAAAAAGLARYVYAVEFDEIDLSLGEPIRKALEEAIRSDREELEVRRRAVEAIAYINDDAVRHIIDIAYDDDELKMQVSAVFAMGRSADTRWAHQVMRELESPEPELRFEAARAAGEMQLREAVPLLAELIQSSDSDLQYQSIWALGQIGGDAVRDILEDLSQAEDPEIVELAEAALEESSLAEMMFDMLVVDEDTDLHEMDMSEFDLDDEDDLIDDDECWDDDVISLN